MKSIGLILSILGGLITLGLWLMIAFSCSCALPPQYARPIYPVDPTPLLGRSFGDVIILGTPLLALVGIVMAILVALPRFRVRRYSRIEIICGLVLVIFLSILSIGYFKPHDLAAFIPAALFGTFPGLLVISGELMARRTLIVLSA